MSGEIEVEDGHAVKDLEGRHHGTVAPTLAPEDCQALETLPAEDGAAVAVSRAVEKASKARHDLAGGFPLWAVEVGNVGEADAQEGHLVGLPGVERVVQGTSGRLRESRLRRLGLRQGGQQAQQILLQ